MIILISRLGFFTRGFESLHTIQMHTNNASLSQDQTNKSSPGNVHICILQNCELLHLKRNPCTLTTQSASFLSSPFPSLLFFPNFRANDRPRTQGVCVCRRDRLVFNTGLCSMFDGMLTAVSLCIALYSNKQAIQCGKRLKLQKGAH